MSHPSAFQPIPAAPPDPILGLTEQFLNDPNPARVNLGVGVYQNESGKVPVLKVVQEAEKRLLEEGGSRTYLPIDGLPAYRAAVQALLFGEDAPAIAESRLVTAQAPGGTGALRVAADFLKRFFPDSTVWISNPSWENHRALFGAAGFPVSAYPYYDRDSHGLEFDAMMQALHTIPARDIVVLHVCCHNPTGVDLVPEQWDAVVRLFSETGAVPLLDFAYQGFGAGLEEDAYAVRAFAAAGVPGLVANSFSKSFSLYGERVGGLTLMTSSAEEARRVASQLKRSIRTNYSNPPLHGGQVVATVLADEALHVGWEAELAEMRKRIHRMRTLFVDSLEAKGVRQDFSFIRRQNGMFSYSGLTLEQVRALRRDYSIYIVDSGRICVAAMNTRNMETIVSAIAAVTG